MTRQTESESRADEMTVFNIVMAEKARLVLLTVLSLILAVSEGFSVSILIPILEGGDNSAVFKNVPGLNRFLEHFATLPREEQLYWGLLALIAAILVRGVTQFLAQALSALIPLDVQCRLMTTIYRAFTGSDLSHAQSHDAAISRTLLREHPQRAAAVVRSVAEIIMCTVLVVFFASFMVALSWQMTLAALIALGLGFLAMKKLGKPWFYWAGERLTRVFEALHSVIDETLRGFELVKLRNAEAIMIDRFESKVADLRYVESRRLALTELQNPVFTTGAGLFICALIALGSLMFDAGDKEWSGLIVLFILCLYRMLGPVTRIVTAHAMYSGNIHAFEAIQSFLLSAEKTRLPDGDVTFGAFEKSIALRDVEVVYDTERGAVLRGVNLDIARGETVALVGPSGAGKSTILSLILRLRDPEKGRVIIDGRPLTDIVVSSWRQRISTVSQNIVIFNDTVRGNLTFGLHGISEKMIWDAVNFAAANDFISQLPDQLDTKLGDDGNQLSGGQKQRIAIARAILADPDILILDEATSQLDAITESAIKRTLIEFHGKKTIIVVAHRLSTIRNADKIVVMNKGSVEAVGNHDKLYRMDGLYRWMLDAQEFGADQPSENSAAQ